MSLRTLKIGALLALAAYIGLSEYRAHRFKQQCRSDQLRQTQSFETLDGRIARHAEQLELRQQEFARWMPELSRQIEAMHISLKRVEQVQTSAMQTRTTFTTLLRDTVVQTDTLRLFNYATPYLQVAGVARGDSQRVDIALQDTLLQVVHRGKRIRPWLWIFSRRELIQTARLANPDARLHYNRKIEITK